MPSIIQLTHCVGRDKEGTWKLTNQARHDQEELIRELSAIQKQREEQLNSISRDLEQSVQFVQELQAEVRAVRCWCT